MVYRLKMMVFNPGDNIVIHWQAITGGAKGPIIAKPPCAPSDLTDFAGTQEPFLAPVELS